MHPERGKLLFRVPAEQQRQQIIWTLVAGVMALIVAYDFFVRHQPDWSMVIFFGGYALSLALSRKVTFYENGIDFPQDPAGRRTRGFVAWSQIDRFHWEGNILTVIPDAALLGPGGGSLGAPLPGGSARVPESRRVQVENLLANARTARPIS